MPGKASRAIKSPRAVGGGKIAGSVGSSFKPSGPLYGNDPDYASWGTPQGEAGESGGGVNYTQPSRQPITTTYQHDDPEFAEPCADPYDSPESGAIGETPQQPLVPNGGR